MKTVDVITLFDKLRPNSFDYRLKRSWLDSVETDIRRFASLHMENKVDLNFVNEENPTLFADDSFMDMYTYYLISMGDMANGEYRLYNISSAYFNGIFEKWKRMYRSEHKPLKGASITY